MNKKWIVNYHGLGNCDWIDNYTSNYIIYDKTGMLSKSDRVISVPNIGYNIYDYLHFIINNYDDLPDVCVFLKANIFARHCRKEIFDRLIEKNTFTPLENYGDKLTSDYERRAKDGGYLEYNNGWYILQAYKDWGEDSVRYIRNFNYFLQTMFDNPILPEWVRFSPGANYIVPKNNIIYYSIDFWKQLFSFVSYRDFSGEAFVIERGLYYIFSNSFEERKIGE